MRVYSMWKVSCMASTCMRDKKLLDRNDFSYVTVFYKTVHLFYISRNTDFKYIECIVHVPLLYMWLNTVTPDVLHK